MHTYFYQKYGAHTPFRLFAAVVLACFSALSVCAQSVTYNHVKYNVSAYSKAATAAGTDGSFIKMLEIADSVTCNKVTYPVTAVGSGAFKDNRYISSIVFGRNLKKIGSNAFTGCEQLTKVVIPEGVETIEKAAFQNCAIRYADLPSTLRTLGSNMFQTNSATSLDTLVLRTAYYDAEGKMKVLPFNTNFFNNTIKNTCTLLVPKRAYEFYVYRTVDNADNTSLNWGSFFTHIVPFGTPPAGCSVAPQEPLKDYRDLSTIEVTLDFDDETLTDDILSLGADGHIEATLLVSSPSAAAGQTAKTICASAAVVKGNTISLDFADVLHENRDLFIASSEEESTVDVRLRLDGEIQIEECPFSLNTFFAQHPISWSVPLLPSVYDLPSAPAATPSGETEDGLYDYTAFESVTLAFDGYTEISLDSSKGAYINARLLKGDGTLLAVSQTATVTGDNAVAIPFAIPAEQLLVRRSSGVESYDFMLEVEGQVSMKAGDEERNYRFALPLDAATASPVWQVRALYIPEPTSVSFLPADETVTLERLSDIAVVFDGVSEVSFSTAADALAPTAALYKEGEKIAVISADRMRIDGHTLYLSFDAIDESLITLITADKDFGYAFTLGFAADITTDGYPCRVLIGQEPASIAEATDAYTQHWESPCWRVPAAIHEVPELTVHVSAAVDVTDYEQLRVVELCVDNYEKVAPMPTSDGSFAVARLVRSGHPVCGTKAVTVEGNKIVIDFSDTLDYNAVGITPDEEAEQLVALSLFFEGDLLFDGLPYHLVYDGEQEGQEWSLHPVVIYKLPAPTIEHDGNRICFTCATEGVEYHYTITNADKVEETTQQAVKGNGGSSLHIPVERTYVISVYASREGYEDSDTVSATLRLKGTPSMQLSE